MLGAYDVSMFHLGALLSRIDLRLSIALAIGRIAGMVSRRLRVGGGTTFPGVVAERFDAHILDKLAGHLSRGTILVTGTNGKTTTSRLLATILKQCGWTTIHNRAGANLQSGLTTALLGESDFGGHPRAEWGLFEVDEAVLPQLVVSIRPKIVVITNLFRDQLDRYGEIAYLAARWRQALQRLPAASTVVLNVDDPTVASLGRGVSARVVGYGMNVSGDRLSRPDHTADSKDCPICGAELSYSGVHYAHLGFYACPNGDFRRPSPDFAVSSLLQHGAAATEMEITGPFGRRQWRVGLPGLYNSYNVLAAVAAARAMGVPMKAIDAAVDDFRAAFGRFERIEVDNRTLCIVLVKNPVGFTEVLRTILSEEGEHHLVILINDNLADGTDVSWLWDVDMEILARRCVHTIVGGARSGDMAVRLKYAGVPHECIEEVESVKLGIDRGMASVPEGGTLYALPTYTAMLELREIAARRHYTASFWKT